MNVDSTTPFPRFGWSRADQECHRRTFDRQRPLGQIVGAALIRQLEYTGVGCVQFLTDRTTGDAYFLEINPRLDATCALPCAVGIDFPLYAVNCSLRDQVAGQRRDVDYAAGIRIHYLMGDLQGLAHGLKDRSVSVPTALRWIYRMGKASLSAKVHMTFQWSDPAPTVRLYANLFKVFRCLMHRIAVPLKSDRHFLCYERIFT